MTHPLESSAGSPMVLDEKQLDSICDGDRDFERMLCTEFRKTTGEALDALREAVEARDAARTHAQAHSIKGSALTLGGQALAQACHRLERLSATEPDWAAAGALDDEIHEHFQRLALALEARAAAA